MVTATAPGIGERFCSALARKDFATLGTLFTDDARLRALVPTAYREYAGAGEIAKRFETWFINEQQFKLEDHSSEEMADRVRVRYCFSCVDPEKGPYLVEQQAYLEMAGDKIAVFSLVCSGFRKRI